MILIKLFLTFFRIGLFAIGGAYSFLPLIEKEAVEKYGWLTKSEFLEILGMVKVMPGAISIKYATYTGYKIAGVYGAIVANLGNLFAPILIIIFSSIFYFKYKDLPYIKAAFRTIQLAAFAMILAVAFKLIDINLLFQFKSIIIVIISFSLFMYTRIHPALIILVAGVLGAVSTFIRH